MGLGALGAAMFALPFAGLAARTPWRDVPGLLVSGVVVDALQLSLVTSLAAAAVSLVLGVPLAWLLSRVEFPGRTLVRAMVTLPMVSLYSTLALLRSTEIEGGSLTGVTVIATDWVLKAP